MPDDLLSPFEVALLVLLVLALVLILRQLLWLTLRGTRRAWRGVPPRLRQTALWQRAGPWWARAAERYPRAHAVLAARLDPHVPTGLPLTLLAAAALYIAALLGGLVEEVMEADEIQAVDDAVNGALALARLPAAVIAFAWITDLGSTATLTAVGLVATGFLWAYRQRWAVLPLWLTTLGAQATTYAGKFALDRARPDFLTFVTAGDPSFPSGHTTGATAVYGFLAYVLVRDQPSPHRRFELAFWTVVLILLIGFSRAFLSVHFASDVAAGFLVGGFWLLVGFAVAEWRRRERPPPDLV